MPWQWVSDADLVAWGGPGLISRGFKSIVLPGLVGVNSSSVLPVLLDFVGSGGTLVADAPIGMLETPASDLVDHFQASPVANKMLCSSTRHSKQRCSDGGSHSWSELFGAGVTNWQSTSNGYDRVISVLPTGVGRVSTENKLLVQGITADLRAVPGQAELVMEPSDGQPDGRPWASAAVWQRPVAAGGGRSILVAFELGRLAFAEPPSDSAAATLWPVVPTSTGLDHGVGAGGTGGALSQTMPPMSGLGAWADCLARAAT